jgi:hypothetical protein
MVDGDMRLLDIGDISCPCGHVYRYALTADGAAFWPQNSVWGFSVTPVDDDACVRCSEPLIGLVRGAREHAHVA